MVGIFCIRLCVAAFVYLIIFFYWVIHSLYKKHVKEYERLHHTHSTKEHHIRNDIFIVLFFFNLFFLKWLIWHNLEIYNLKTKLSIYFIHFFYNFTYNDIILLSSKIMNYFIFKITEEIKWKKEFPRLNCCLRCIDNNLILHRILHILLFISLMNLTRITSSIGMFHHMTI